MQYSLAGLAALAQGLAAAPRLRHLCLAGNARFSGEGVQELCLALLGRPAPLAPRMHTQKGARCTF